jgi:hypothetical protein
MKRPPWFLLVPVLAGLAARCAPRQPAASDGPTPAAAEHVSFGVLKIVPASSVPLTLSPSVCTAGAREVFYGADFEDPASGLVLRLAVDPVSGPALRLFPRASPFEKNLLFRRSECRSFRFSLDATGWRVGTTLDYRASLDVDCTNASGDSITGKVAAAHCH